MTSIRQGEPEHFVSQAVHIGDETVVLTAQRTTCPALVITPRVDVSELGSIRLVDGLVLVHRTTGMMIAAGQAESLHDLAERLSTVVWDLFPDGTVLGVEDLSLSKSRALGIESATADAGKIVPVAAVVELRTPAGLADRRCAVRGHAPRGRDVRNPSCRSDLRPDCGWTAARAAIPNASEQNRPPALTGGPR